MTLRRKTIAIIGATHLGLIMLLYAVAQIILLSGFAQLEDQGIHEDIERARSTFADELARLEATTADYAHWDDTYAFVQDGNSAYIEANLSSETFANLGVNLAAFVNAQGEVVFARAFDLGSGEEAAIPPEIGAQLPADSPLLNAPDQRTGVSGILELADGPMLVAAYPILTSQLGGPSAGSLIFGSFLNDQKMQQFAASAHLTLAAFPYNNALLPGDVQQARSTLSVEAPAAIQTLDANTVAGYSLLTDVYGQPALILRTQASRHVYAQGQTSLSYLVLSLAAAGVITGGMMLLLLEKGVLSRVSQLSASIRQMGDSTDLSL